MNFKNIKHFLIILWWTLFASWLVYAYFWQTIGQQFNYTWLYAGNYNDTSGKIVIVKVDNKTLDALQTTDLKVLNFTKTQFAHLVEKLENFHAKTIGFDIVFANKSEDSNILVKTFQKYKNIVIGAKIGTNNAERILPLEIYTGATWGSVDVAYNKESNILSRFSPFLTLENQPIEAMSIALYRKYTNDNNNRKWVIQNGKYILSPIQSLPLDASWNMMIRFFNEPEKYSSVSMIDVLNAKTPEELQKLQAFFSDKIVLIGEYGTLIHDDHFSPVDTRGKMPGVEFHANMLDGILQNKTLVGQSSVSVWITAILLAALLIGSFYIAGTWAAIITLIVTIFSLIVIGRRLITWPDEGIVINLFFYLVTTMTAFIGTYVYKYLIVDKGRRQIEWAFSRYIAPDVVAEIARNPESLKLGWERRKIAIFFSDIANFTTISESLGTEKIFSLLSDYLSEMTDILVANRWTLDKYIGDAVMWFFWAPHAVDRPSYRACKTALEQQKKLTKLNEKWKKKEFPAVVARIGINTWDAMVGNIGSEDRFNYTAIGDNVNLASRLEWVNKEYGTLICVSAPVYEETKDDFHFRQLDTIRVKGKTEWIKIYELLGEKDISKEEKYLRYEEWLELYYAEKYKEALEIFSANTTDFTSEILAIRCKKILTGDIIVRDGIYEMKEK